MRKRAHLLAKPCPCGSERSYGDCCARFHGTGAEDAVPAPTPEALMRSRYSAYVLELGDYLLATWHPATAPGELDMGGTKWLGLEVREAHASGDVGVVEFVARYRDGSGRGGRLHETSRFMRDDGRWLYIDGVIEEG